MGFLCGNLDHSYEVAQGFPGADHDPGCFCLLCVAGIHFVGDHPVLRFVYEVEDLEPEVIKSGCLEVAFKEGMLDSGAEVFAHIGHLREALWVGDVVGNNDEHLGLGRG